MDRQDELNEARLRTVIGQMERVGAEFAATRALLLDAAVRLIESSLRFSAHVAVLIGPRTLYHPPSKRWIKLKDGSIYRDTFHVWPAARWDNTVVAEEWTAERIRRECVR